MIPTPPPDEDRLQSFYETQTKYLPSPVPTPLDRAAAIKFVSARTNRETPPERMRKLMRLAVFYDLHETGAAFSRVLTANEHQPEDFVRSALCLIALAWIGDPDQQASAQRYYRTLQDRADVDLHRGIMLEVVEAFGPREGTGYHRRWIQAAIAGLQGSLSLQQADNIPSARLTQEKINALTEYLNIQLLLVDRAFSIRQRIETIAPPSSQVPSFVGYSLSITADSTPQLSYWASMRLLHMERTLSAQIGGEFYISSSGGGGADPNVALVRARALRAAEYFGHTLPEPDRAWLARQPDAGTDPIVLRPRYYMELPPANDKTQ